MKKILIAVFAAILFMGCSADDQKQSGVKKFTPFKVGEEVVLKGVNGKEFTLIRTEGAFKIKGAEEKVLMLDIFGTFCLPCQKEAPEIMQYQLDNLDRFIIIGLTHFEDVSDEYVLNEFMQKYNAFYFITNNQKINDRIAEQVVADIGYQHEIALPFKVVIKNGEYQILTDIATGSYGIKYYIGGIKMKTMKQDMDRIYNLK